jgi:5-methylcytosine-specific restriction enzyme A
MKLRTIGSKLKPSTRARLRQPEKTADPYYLSPAHRAWREQVIAQARGHCQWPDCKRQLNAYGGSERRMFADHKRERRDGGDLLDPANGWCLCGSHHTLKTTRERARRAGAGPHTPHGG